MTYREELTPEEKYRDGHDGYLVALHGLRMAGIREGTIEPLSEEERREAWEHQTQKATPR